MAQPTDEHVAAILAQLQQSFDQIPGASKKDQIQTRRNRVLVYTYQSGLTTRTIAAIEHVDQSQIARDLIWWKQRVSKATQKADELIGDLELRFDAIYQGALQDVQTCDNKSPSYYRDRARLRMVALAASVALTRLREGTGRIGMLGTGTGDAGRAPSPATDVRRLAEEVRRLTGHPFEDINAIDLTAPGERAYLDGDVSSSGRTGDPDPLHVNESDDGDHLPD